MHMFPERLRKEERKHIVKTVAVNSGQPIIIKGIDCKALAGAEKFINRKIPKKPNEMKMIATANVKARGFSPRQECRKTSRLQA